LDGLRLESPGFMAGDLDAEGLHHMKVLKIAGQRTKELYFRVSKGNTLNGLLERYLTYIQDGDNIHVEVRQFFNRQPANTLVRDYHRSKQSFFYWLGKFDISLDLIDRVIWSPAHLGGELSLIDYLKTYVANPPKSKLGHFVDLDEAFSNYLPKDGGQWDHLRGWGRTKFWDVRLPSRVDGISMLDWLESVGIDKLLIEQVAKLPAYLVLNVDVTDFVTSYIANPPRSRTGDVSLKEALRSYSRNISGGWDCEKGQGEGISLYKEWKNSRLNFFDWLKDKGVYADLIGKVKKCPAYGGFDAFLVSFVECYVANPPRSVQGWVGLPRSLQVYSPVGDGWEMDKRGVGGRFYDHFRSSRLDLFDWLRSAGVSVGLVDKVRECPFYSGGYS
jgi:hypothetical protein